MRKFIILLIFIIAIILLFAFYIEPQSLKVNEYTIESKELPLNFDNFKIAHFSDVLYENNLEALKKAVKEINKTNPNIIVFTGDLLSKKANKDNIEDLIKELKKLKASEYKYAILGDNDTKESKEVLEESNFIILDNSSEYIFMEEETPILIAGGDKLTKDILEKDISIECNYTIALIHKPDSYDDIKDLKPSLVLAGHSLGGEINLPLWGPLIKYDGSTKYTTNNYKNLYISNGIGLGKTKMRILNNPSINIYRLYVK